MALADTKDGLSLVASAFKDGLRDTTQLDLLQMKDMLSALGMMQRNCDLFLEAMIKAIGNPDGTVGVDQFISWLFRENPSRVPYTTAAVSSTSAGRDGSQPLFTFVHASILVQLQETFKKYPFAEPGKSLFLHPAHDFVETCRKCLDARKLEQAQEALGRVKNLIDTDCKQISEAFRRFDMDNSGFLDEAECRHLNAYLGWSSEQWNMPDLNKDNKVSLEEFVAFVGRLGGVRQLFEQRRLRVSTSRKDVCDYIGVAEGARVRAHYYVQGQKSMSWKEAQVIRVGVQRHFGDASGGMGPGTLGVLLQFGFGAKGSTKMWTARQVVPPTWILSGVEDAAVISALRESGILDEQQTFWSLLLPETELQAIARLTSCQRNALSIVRAQATKLHDEALLALKERFQKLGYSHEMLSTVCEWIQDIAPVCVHLHLDKMGAFMEQDEFYRNQFETKTSCGSLDPQNRTRKGWERELFGGAYEDAKPFERCKYGALSVMNDYRGVVSARQYGDSYLVLKDVRLRCTFASTDSGGLAGSRLAVLDKYAHVLKEYNDSELEGVISVAEAAKAAGASESSVRSDLLRGSTEDPVVDWVTMGYPQIAETCGCLYFEVKLLKGTCTPQVGVVSKEFKLSPGVASNEGVGDDENSWSVDGVNCIRWHNGVPMVWNQTWKPADDQSCQLAEDVTVGVAVDFNQRILIFSTNGVWDDTSTFKDIPEVALYPAISFKGKAIFCFGPSFKYHPPLADSAGSKYGVWPKAPQGSHRVDVPLVGNSEILSTYKEVQIHGELSLKRNVQRLVAARKYRESTKMERSWGLTVTSAGVCSGKYKRSGGHDGMPLYKNKAGCMVYYDSASAQWRISDKEDDFTTIFARADAVGYAINPPSLGWVLLDEARGLLKSTLWRAGLQAKGASTEVIESLAAKIVHKAEDGEEYAWRAKEGVCFDDEWGKLEEPPSDASQAWKAGVTLAQNELLNEYGLSGAQMVETEHPYPAVGAKWKKEVTIDGAAALVIHFDSRCQTYDSCCSVTVHAGGMRRDAAGPGARLELQACCGQKIWGTAVEKSEDGMWKVLLDREKSERAIEEIAIYNSAAPTDVSVNCFAYCRESVKRFQVNYENKDSSCDAKGSGLTIGDEILSFKLDRTSPMTPIIVEKLSSTFGPAQEAGVREGWYIDLVRTFGGPSREVLASILDGIGGIKLDQPSQSTEAAAPAAADGKDEDGHHEEEEEEGYHEEDEEEYHEEEEEEEDKEEDEVQEPPPSAACSMMLEAAMANLDQFLALLNEKVRALHEATIWFIDSSGVKKPTLMPEAHVMYGAEEKPSADIKALSMHKGNVIIAEFNGEGAAKAAGVRLGWALDIPKTLALNENFATSLKSCPEEDLLPNAKAVLEQPGICLVFQNLKPTKTQILHAYGSPDSGTWNSCEVVGDYCEFTFKSDGDGSSYPERRWGFWALLCAKPQEAAKDSQEPKDFVVEVEYDESASLGIETNHTRDGLLITALSAGLIEDWNNASSDEKVKVRDRILQVNDVKDPEGMISELAKHQKLKLLLRHAKEICEKAKDDSTTIPCPVKDVDACSKRYRQLTGKAEGNQEKPNVSCDAWTHERLLALCAQHGWDFEWQTEDGERRRRASETLTTWKLQESMVALLHTNANTGDPDGTVSFSS